jgi:hypothetical protein
MAIETPSLPVVVWLPKRNYSVEAGLVCEIERADFSMVMSTFSGGTNSWDARHSPSAAEAVIQKRLSSQR